MNNKIIPNARTVMQLTAKVWFICIICFSLTACFNMQNSAVKKTVIHKKTATWITQKKQRTAINNWELRGKLGVQTEYNGIALDIIWKQSGRDYTMRLIAPLGASTYLINGDDEHAEIHSPDGKTKIINNLDEAFLSALEVKLPVEAVKDWIKGLPADKLPIQSIRLNKKGLINKIEQAGWNVEMAKYSGAKLEMPHALYLSHDDDEALDIRLIIRRWMIDN
jgi:outer membrane lipoprotein LolB